MTTASATNPGTRLWAWANRHTKWVLSLPAAVFVLLMLIVPLGYTIYLSFMDAFGSVRKPLKFVGFDNYVYIFTNGERFWPAVWRTFIYSVATVGIELVLGLAIALLLRQAFRGQSFVRSVILLPLVATPVAVGMAWLLIFEPTIGVANQFMRMLGLPAQDWLASPSQALPTLIFIDVWQWTPIMVVILLSGLVVLPEEPYEAAQVDGAGPVQVFRFITLPMLAPAIITAVLLRSIDAIKTFDMIYATKGPGGGTQHEAETLNILAYDLSFNYSEYGRGSALLVFFFIVILFIVYLLAKLRERWGAVL
ncbi:carbohydrate ABC transporter permease [Microbacterium alcoholitolerans]|uniref:carbohydrate ABC transporter permease n=1 Tax=unclassified Microbacterium TaxID=2609290 RepID=UPI003D166CE3